MIFVSNFVSGSKDQTVIIWNVDNYGVKFHKLVEIGKQVTYLSWSQNDKMLLITGIFNKLTNRYS